MQFFRDNLCQLCGHWFCFWREFVPTVVSEGLLSARIRASSYQRAETLTGFTLTFAAGQIDQVEFSRSNVILAVLADAAHLHADGEDGMAAGRVGVHQRGARTPVLPATLHQRLALSHRMDGKLGQACNIM